MAQVRRHPRRRPAAVNWHRSTRRRRARRPSPTKRRSPAAWPTPKPAKRATDMALAMPSSGSLNLPAHPTGSPERPDDLAFRTIGACRSADEHPRPRIRPHAAADALPGVLRHVQERHQEHLDRRRDRLLRRPRRPRPQADAGGEAPRVAAGGVLRHGRLDRVEQPGAQPVPAHQRARSPDVPVAAALRGGAARAVLPHAARQLPARHGRARGGVRGGREHPLDPGQGRVLLQVDQLDPGPRSHRPQRRDRRDRLLPRLPARRRRRRCRHAALHARRPRVPCRGGGRHRPRRPGLGLRRRHDARRAGRRGRAAAPARGAARRRLRPRRGAAHRVDTGGACWRRPGRRARRATRRAGSRTRPCRPRPRARRRAGAACPRA